jgi:hypothetical protein
MNLEDSVRLLTELTGGLQPTDGSTESQLRTIRELVAHCLLLDQTEPLFPPDDPFSLVPVHKRTFFRGAEGRRVGRVSAGARRFRVEVAAEVEGIVWRARLDRRI